MNEAHGVFGGGGGSVRARGWNSCPGHPLPPPGVTVPSAQLPGSNAVRRGGAVGLIHSPHNLRMLVVHPAEVRLWNSERTGRRKGVPAHRGSELVWSA